MDTYCQVMNVVSACITLTVMVMVWMGVGVGASPRRGYGYGYDGQPSQACGDKLADIMKLVCYGRGYNVAFRPQARSSHHRIRRGIVEECCRKSCSPAMLELYCQPDPLETTSNVQIRKRSDSGADSTESNTEKGPRLNKDITKLNTFNPLLNEIKPQDSTTKIKEGKDDYKILNLLVSMEHSSSKHGTRNSLPNDTTEEELNRQSTMPPLRHHKNHHYRAMHGRKPSTKAKREQLLSEETQTFQIGAVKPYFSGRALASYRSSYHRPT